MNRGAATIPQHVIDSCRMQGLFGDTELRLKRILRRSAPVTSPYGNRRFFDWFLAVSDGKIESVTRIQPQTQGDPNAS